MVDFVEERMCLLKNGWIAYWVPGYYKDGAYYASESGNDKVITRVFPVHGDVRIEA